MALVQNDHAKGVKQTPVPAEYGVAVTARFSYDLDTDLSVGDIIEMGALPANATVVDMVLDSDDLDSNGTPTLALDVGLMSGAYQDADDARTCGNEFYAADTTAQAGGITRMSKQAGFRVAKTQADRGIGVKIETAAATFQAGTVTLLVTYVQA